MRRREFLLFTLAEREGDGWDQAAAAASGGAGGGGDGGGGGKGLG